VYSADFRSVKSIKLIDSRSVPSPVNSVIAAGVRSTNMRLLSDFLEMTGLEHALEEFYPCAIDSKSNRYYNKNHLKIAWTKGGTQSGYDIHFIRTTLEFKDRSST